MEERAVSRRGMESVAEALKVPPQSVEAEQSVLGGLLLDNQGWDRIADIITADDFYRREHRLIFQAVSALCEESSPADVVTVSEWLERSGELATAGGLAYLGSLANNTPGAANIVAYAAIVRECSVMRELARAASDISSAIYTPEGRSANELLDLAEKRIFDISEKGHRRGDFHPLNTLLSKAVDRIDELFRSKSSITGVATGFTDLDEMTSGLQGSDLIIIAGRPSMGKCIVAGSRLLDPRTGRLETIEHKVKQHRGELVSLDRCGRLRVAAASHFVDDGNKPAYRVRTALGREISVTLTHPFLTLDGWKPLGDLHVDDFIAVPRTLPFFGRRETPEALVKLTAYFLTDGGLTHTVPKFTNANARIRRDFGEATRHFPGLRCKLETSGGTRTPTVCVVRDFGLIRRARRAFAARLQSFLDAQRISLHALARQLDVAVATVHYWAAGVSSPSVAILPRLQAALDAYPGARDVFTSESLHKNGSNPMTNWLQSLGLWGLDAHGKRVPEFVFELSREQLALFLNRAFACDGSIYVQNGDQAGVSYSTVSLDLARDMQHLLLRFGLLAKLRVRRIRYRGERRTAYELRLTRQEDIRCFVEEIGLFGKERAAERALRVSLSKRPKVNLDTIPACVWTLIERKKGDRSWAELARALGYGDGFNLHVGKRGLSRARLRRIADALDDEELRNLAEADVYWDRIERIEYLGRRRVYDLTVPEHHNFVAEDMLVHNTSLAMNIAENAAVGHKIPVAVFSMEMPGTQLALRMMASLGRINAHRVRTGKLDDDDWPRLTSAVSLLNEAPIFIDDSPALTPMELRARARRLKREHGLGLIIIDYLQLMQSTERTEENRATEISNITRALKGLAKELDVPVIAMSQLNRSVESRTDKRPVMSDLRECVTGDTLVCLTNGRRVPIRDLEGTMPEVWAMSEDQCIVAARSDAVWKVGRRPILKVALASGRELRATAKHRIFSGRGWSEVAELKIGDRVALSRELPESKQPVEWPELHLILLAHLVGDGSYLSHQPLRYTTASEENSEVVAKAARDGFGVTVKRHPGRQSWHQLVFSGNGNRWRPAGINRWLRDLGIFGQRSCEKHLPAGVFSLPNTQVGLLLRHLWATDGSISVRTQGGASRVYFSTCSQQLAMDVAALLLRLSIVARIRKVKQRRGRDVYTVDVSGTAQQQKFLASVGAFGPRVAPARALREVLTAIKPNPNVDTLPQEIFEQVKERMRDLGISQRRMAASRGTAYGGTSHFRFAPSRDTLATYAMLLDDPELRLWTTSDLFWDRIVAVIPDGEEEVYDLTVPGPASWLADGIVSHNSGAIEQDADVILFIYRDEVYNKDSPVKGTADIIIGKQRNGPIGEVRLTFLGEYTRFENYTTAGYDGTF